MRKNKKNLKGSPNTDTFKYLHKQRLPGSFYATDVDLVLMDHLGPIAVIDFKTRGDKVTYTEALLYRWFMGFSLPVFIIETKNPERGPFLVMRVHSFNIQENEVITVWSEINEMRSWTEIEAWEKSLREKGY